MAAVDVGGGGGKRVRGKKRKARRRVSVRIDMTPMVDVVLLLITFFMLATVFNTPQTMEINIPPVETKVEVAESSLLTLRIDQYGTVFWNMGMEKPQLVEFKELRKLLEDHLKENPKLITLVKVSREATYTNMVDIMDELNLASITRFSLANFSKYDQEVIPKPVL